MPDLDKRQQDILALTRELLTRLEREDLTELSVTRGEIRVRVRRDDRGVARVVAADATGERALPERRDEGADEVDAGVIEVKAPLTGVFYRSGSPQSPPYVQAGATVTVGQVIGLIEAMKLFNEIRSTAAGRVRRVLVETGQFVRAQSPLLEVEPL
ncbi:MAG: acetyl-CoA carboxylase, biotin carboxyl carrier protein [Chloroflexi bacterium]|nr:MAG: acetyl-CoA carboxylase, biotin carboxyl carrier protein [Chloroflexota bacterium]